MSQIVLFFWTDFFIVFPLTISIESFFQVWNESLIPEKFPRVGCRKNYKKGI